MPFRYQLHLGLIGLSDLEIRIMSGFYFRLLAPAGRIQWYVTSLRHFFLNSKPYPGVNVVFY